jgi:hypothetical protein
MWQSSARPAALRRLARALPLVLLVLAACGGGSSPYATPTGTGGQGGRPRDTTFGVGCGLTCAEYGAECGLYQPADCSLAYECGTCAAPLVCGAAAANRCGRPGTWTIDQSARSVFLFDVMTVWGSGRSDVWAGDSYGMVGIYDGISWRELVNLGSGNGVTAIHGSGPNNIWISTVSGYVYQVVDNQIVPHRVSTGEIEDVWTGGPNEAWATGFITVFRWDGTTFGNSGPSGLDATGVWGVPGGGPLWVVSRDGWVSKREGGTWTDVIASGLPLGRITGIDAENIWAVGRNIYRFVRAGTSYETVGVLPTDQIFPTYYGLWVQSPTNVWAVGTEGLIAHGDGRHFEIQPSPTKSNLHTIWGSGPGDIWVGGPDGLMMHYTQ